jgi:hypothetical protein
LPRGAGAAQRLHDARLLVGAVERQLDRQHVRVVGRFQDEALHRGLERVARERHHHLALAQRVEDRPLGGDRDACSMSV